MGWNAGWPYTLGGTSLRVRRHSWSHSKVPRCPLGTSLRGRQAAQAFATHTQQGGLPLMPPRHEPMGLQLTHGSAGFCHSQTARWPTTDASKARARGVATHTQQGGLMRLGHLSVGGARRRLVMQHPGAKRRCVFLQSRPMTPARVESKHGGFRCERRTWCATPAFLHAAHLGA